MVVTHDLSLAARFQRQLEMKEDGQLESQEAISGVGIMAQLPTFYFLVTALRFSCAQGRKRAGMVSLLSDYLNAKAWRLRSSALIIGLSAKRTLF